MLTHTHFGILQDIARKGHYDLKNIASSWTQDRLIEIIMLDDPPLIHISDDHVVTLTAAGWKAVTDVGPGPYHSLAHGIDSLWA